MPQLTEYYIDSKKVALFFFVVVVVVVFLYLARCISFINFITDYLA